MQPTAKIRSSTIKRLVSANSLTPASFVSATCFIARNNMPFNLDKDITLIHDFRPFHLHNGGVVWNMCTVLENEEQIMLQKNIEKDKREKRIKGRKHKERKNDRY